MCVSRVNPAMAERPNRLQGWQLDKARGIFSRIGWAIAATYQLNSIIAHAYTTQKHIAGLQKDHTCSEHELSQHDVDRSHRGKSSNDCGSDAAR